MSEFAVSEVDRLAADAVRRVVIETVAREAARPECGTLSARVKDRPLDAIVRSNRERADTPLADTAAGACATTVRPTDHRRAGP